MTYIPVKRQRRPSAFVNPKQYRTGYGCIPLRANSFWSDEAKKHVRFVAISDWGYVFRWITDCDMKDYEYISWLYLRDFLECGLRWRILIRWPRTDGLLEQNELFINLGFTLEEQEDYYRRMKDKDQFILQLKEMYFHFWKCFYKWKTCTTRAELIRWMGEYSFNTEWIKSKLPVPKKRCITGRHSRPRSKLKLPSTCLLLERNGTTSRYVCLGFQSSDSMCQTFMSSSPTERASILRQKATSTLKLG